MSSSPNRDNRELTWRALDIIGGIAALIAVIFFRRYFGVELVQFKGFGIIPDVPLEHPSSAVEWFNLFQNNRLVGLALFDLVDLINYALVGLIFLALFGALVGLNRSAMVVATTFAFVGIAVYFASHQAFAMLSLSDQYMATKSEEHRVMLSAAGEALLAIHNPGGIYQGTGMYVSLFLVLLAGLIVSIVMLQGDRLGRIAAIVGILANGFGLSYFIALIFWPEILWIPPTLSAPFRMIWYILIAVKLFKLSRGENWTGKRIK
jgi:hypothetical protein